MEINKEFATLILPEKEPIQIPVITDNMGAKSIDIHSLRKETGYITYDPGFVNTGSCTSSICYVNGEQGILRYRGYDIEDLVENCDFVEVAYLLIKGELPNASERKRYAELLNQESLLNHDMQSLFRGYPFKAHPMSVLAAMSVSLSAFYPEMDDIDPELQVDFAVTRLVSKIRTIVAFTYRHMRGEDFVNPSYKYSYCENFLNMMFKSPVIDYQINPLHVKALNQLLILHADHEQNCSTTAVRLIASSEANLYASISAGICALWGFKHGGANQAVIEMLEEAYANGWTAQDIVDKAKNKDSGFLLMGFGHRVYKTFDPRAKIAKRLCKEVMAEDGKPDPLLELALELEEVATNDDYFKQRSLYPNIDFYTGLIFRRMGIPTNMFTSMFAIGRLPGWISHWLEWKKDPYGKIGRPRQVYSGPYVRKVQNLNDR
ncbi:MAG: citrate (Si)-synthase [Spirochaetae bacterium HGW-Spirochaetae-4]|jgi:citrate synthase|nr:MAG: citrate (Si)-synthase [Spirochaetes bacterium GWC2_52_13]PKL11565.1 MAG: citrate (Si)-synthase [Spirochaetae bacterium HGW-Spirochaetae-8]PKL20236.1 MAG: citrate (Si)-synthase [Spirochaetae bacterium HGW-Spirochaetae-4]HCG63448.1 citrate (Si)-synthase [Sphaerochaeta sp.]HCS35587.1 citrate (Si)-synthase [Sphaerochaeta sp.]